MFYIKYNSGSGALRNLTEYVIRSNGSGGMYAKKEKVLFAGAEDARNEARRLMEEYSGIKYCRLVEIRECGDVLGEVIERDTNE